MNIFVLPTAEGKGLEESRFLDWGYGMTYNHKESVGNKKQLSFKN